MNINIKRVYEKPEKDDGKRILVDRLWPRGLSKEKAKVDLWIKEIAPSTTLRKWFSHDPSRWAEFKKSYAKELENKEEQLKIMYALTKNEKITLVYGSKEEHFNDAVVLQEILKDLK